MDRIERERRKKMMREGQGGEKDKDEEGRTGRRTKMSRDGQSRLENDKNGERMMGREGGRRTKIGINSQRGERERVREI